MRRLIESDMANIAGSTVAKYIVEAVPWPIIPFILLALHSRVGYYSSIDKTGMCSF